MYAVSNRGHFKYFSLEADFSMSAKQNNIRETKQHMALRPHLPPPLMNFAPKKAFQNWKGKF